MERKIIKIDKEKCIGCALCVNACHEGAIGMVDNKAVLLRDDYCDGLGNCLPVCPTGAISFETREALPFNEELVNQNKDKQPLACGCPSTNSKQIKRQPTASAEYSPVASRPSSQLNQWPVQIKLVPVNAPYFKNANLLIAADCTAFSYGDFHERFMKNKITLIGCPKLDEGDYSQKLSEILKHNDIKNVTVVRMEVPCCSGIVNSFKAALTASGKQIPWQIVTISTDGEILDD